MWHLHVGGNNKFYIDLRSKAEMQVYLSQMYLICFYWVRDNNNLRYLWLTQHAVMKVKKVSEHQAGLSKWQMHKCSSISKARFLTFAPNESWEMLYKKNWIHISSWFLILLDKEFTDRCNSYHCHNNRPGQILTMSSSSQRTHAPPPSFMLEHVIALWASVCMNAPLHFE